MSDLLWKLQVLIGMRVHDVDQILQGGPDLPPMVRRELYLAKCHLCGAANELAIMEIEEKRKDGEKV